MRNTELGGGNDFASNAYVELMNLWLGWRCLVFSRLGPCERGKECGKNQTIKLDSFFQNGTLVAGVTFERIVSASGSVKKLLGGQMIPHSFIKYHGLGNDFAIFLGGMSDCPPFSSERVAELCKRGSGIGGDGICLARASDIADVRMELINSDGSTPEMCGNGLRCFVKFAVEELGINHNPVSVETNGGVKLCHWHGERPGIVDSVRVDMGQPSFDRAFIPMTGTGSSQNVEIECRGRTFVATGVNTGNPHMVIFGDASLELAKSFGPYLTHHPMWPEGANVEFAEVLGSSEIQVSVWERGCGLTQACGTGATATATAAISLGQCSFDTPITVRLPGGDLAITVETDYRTAWMEGPVVELYRAQLS